MHASGQVSCALLPLDRLSPWQREQWSRLSSGALERNAYLCPEFVLASLELGAGRPPLVLLASTPGPQGPEIDGVGIFEPCGPTAKFPLPHLRAYASPHSFLTGLLIRKEGATDTLVEMLRHLLFGGQGWSAVYFSRLRQDGIQAELLRDAIVRLDANWYEESRSSRAVLDLRSDRRNRWKQHVPPSRHRRIRRCRTKLRALGKVEWRMIDHPVGDAEVETFLRLEHLGWKAAAGSSFRSAEGHERFFRRLVSDFGSTHRVFFTELVLNGTVIASTSNLCVGDQGFAFKVAFDPRYRSVAPGFINEYEFLEALDRVSGLVEIDSGADEGAFIDELWPERTPLAAGYIVGGWMAKRLARGMDAVKRVRRRVRSVWRRVP